MINNYIYEVFGFLMELLSSNCTIALYDTDEHLELIKAKGGYISSKGENSPNMPDYLLNLIDSNLHTFKPYHTMHISNDDKEKEKISIWFIKNDKNKLTHIITVSCKNSNKDISFEKALDIKNLEREGLSYLIGEEEHNNSITAETLEEQINIIIQDIIGDLESNRRISYRETQDTVKKLYDLDAFEIKGAVAMVSSKLGVSESTIYRHLRSIEEDSEHGDDYTYLV